MANNSLFQKELEKFLANSGVAVAVMNPDGTYVASSISLGGVVSLASGTTILAGQSGNWGVNASLPTTTVIGSLNSLASIYGTVSATQSGIWGVNASLPTTTVIGSLNSLPSINGIVTVPNLVSVASINGLIDVKQSGNWGVTASLPTTTVIGSLNSLASIYGLVSITGLIAASLPTTQVIGSLNSLASIYGTVTNAAGANFIGLASVVPAFTPVSSNYTSFATLLSGSGAASIFAPPNGQRFIIKDLIIGSLGSNEVNIQSGGSTVLIPYISLATQGGYVFNSGESGLRGKALNDAFIVNKNSTATLSIFVNVRFDSV